MSTEKRRWTKQEKQYLKANYMTESFADIGRKLCRTRGSVKRACENFGFTRRKEPAKIGDIVNGWKIVEIYNKNIGSQNIACAKVESTINDKTGEYRLTQLTQGKVGWPDRRRPDVSEKNRTHNLTNSRLYSIYNGMKNRCYNKNQLSYKNYGAKGIIVCNEWLNDFKSFYNWAMSNGYDDDLSINRKDLEKGYCPENCEWCTVEQQANNKTTSVKIKAWEETKTLAEWAADKRCFASEKSLKYRITHKWIPEVAISTPSNRSGDTFSKYRPFYKFVKAKYPEIVEEFLSQ